MKEGESLAELEPKSSRTSTTPYQDSSMHYKSTICSRLGYSE